MEIFYVKKEEILNQIDKEILFSFLDKNFESEKRKIEYSLARFFLHKLLMEFYKIDEIEIIEENKKPKLKNGKIKFSISHSKDMIGICFSNDEVGFDIEFMEEKNLDSFSKRYNKNFVNLKEFYEFWTKTEAEIKLQNKPTDYLTFEINNYMVSLASVKKITETRIYEFIGENICIKRLEF